MERKMIITSTNDPEFPYNAQVWSYVNGKWWYGGLGKYCKTLEEALKYASDRNLLVEFN